MAALRDENDAIAVATGAANRRQLEDEETIARILAQDSASMIGQMLPTGLNRLSNQIANI